MISFWQSIVLSTLFLSAISSPTPQDQQQQRRRDQQQQQPPKPSNVPTDVEGFQRLLADIDDSSIHSALHHWSSKFQDGIFSHDRTALEAVHSENAPLATSLLRLAKRQSDNNTTIPSSNPPSSTTDEPESDTPSTSEPESPTVAPSTSEGIILPVSTRTTATRAPTTTAVPVSTPSSATPVATSDDRIVYSVSASSGASQGSLTTVEITSELISYAPSSSIVLSTLTLPNGGLSTQTSITVVDSPVTGGTLGAPVVTATGGANSPTLQEGVASATRAVWKELVAVLGGAVVIGLAM